MLLPRLPRSVLSAVAQPGRLKRLREEGALHIDEAAIFRTIEKMHEIVNEAALATKSARRQRERRLRLIHGGRIDAPSPDQLPADTSNIDEDNKESPQQPWENMLPFEEWT